MMNDQAVHLVARAEIARLAGVRRPAVSNWERRHQTFPAPRAVDRSGTDLFDASEVAAWLADRVVPSHARGDDEAPGITYGQRFLKALAPADAPSTSHPPSGPLLEDRVERLSGADSVRLRGSLAQVDYLRTLLGLIHLKAQGAGWGSVAMQTRQEPRRSVDTLLVSAVRDSLPATLLEQWRGQEETLSAVISAIEEARPGDAAEYSAAFDRVFEERLADAAGSTSGLFTPPSVARTVAALLAPLRAGEQLHDPYCRSAELLTAVLDAGGPSGYPDTRVSGTAAHPETLRIGRMRLGLRGHDADLLQQGTAVPSLRPLPVPADLVVVNPPFNMRGADARHTPPPYWRYGSPPAHNANFDWLQYVAASVSQTGRAGVIMPLNAALTSRGSEKAIRARMVEDGVVECVVQFPPALFSGTTVAVTLWVLRAPTGRCDDILFVNAERLGALVTRTRRALCARETAEIADSYHSWRDARRTGSSYAGVPGFSRAVSLDEIRKRDHALTPSLFVSAGTVPPDTVDHVSRVRELAATLSGLHDEAASVEDEVNRILRRHIR